MVHKQQIIKISRGMEIQAPYFPWFIQKSHSQTVAVILVQLAETPNNCLRGYY